MSYRNQKKYFDILKRYEKKLDETEKYKYKMLLKRHSAEEDLDKIALGYLTELYEKYHVNREKKSYDHIFKEKEE